MIKIAPDLVGEFAYPLPVANETATHIRFQGVNSVDDVLAELCRPCDPGHRIRQVHRHATGNTLGEDVERCASLQTRRPKTYPSL